MTSRGHYARSLARQAAWTPTPRRRDYLDLAEPAPRVRDVILLAPSGRVTVADIQEAALAHYRLGAFDLVSERRARAVSRPRQVAMYLARELTTASLPAIGRRFGGRDHSTVIHAIKRVEARLAAGDGVAADLAALRARLVR